MISNGMRRLHMGCGESLTGVIVLPHHSQRMSTVGLRVKQARDAAIARQEKKKS